MRNIYVHMRVRRLLKRDVQDLSIRNGEAQPAAMYVSVVHNKPDSNMLI